MSKVIDPGASEMILEGLRVVNADRVATPGRRGPFDHIRPLEGTRSRTLRRHSQPW